MLSLMEYNGNFLDDCVETNPPLQDVFSVLSTSFDIDFEPWYLDMSHRVRHGVLEVYRYEKSVLAVQYNINGEALISQVATVTEYRGRGYASKLLSAVCGRLNGSEVFILCEDKLVEFYRKIGFVFKKNYCQLNPRSRS